MSKDILSFSKKKQASLPTCCFAAGKLINTPVHDSEMQSLTTLLKAGRVAGNLFTRLKECENKIDPTMGKRTLYVRALQTKDCR